MEYDGWINIELHHAISPKDLDSFAYRGNVSIPSLNSGLSNIVQKELSSKDVENIKVDLISIFEKNKILIKLLEFSSIRQFLPFKSCC